MPSVTRSSVGVATTTAAPSFANRSSLCRDTTWICGPRRPIRSPRAPTSSSTWYGASTWRPNTYLPTPAGSTSGSKTCQFRLTGGRIRCFSMPRTAGVEPPGSGARCMPRRSPRCGRTCGWCHRTPAPPQSRGAPPTLTPHTAVWRTPRPITSTRIRSRCRWRTSDRSTSRRWKGWHNRRECCIGGISRTAEGRRSPTPTSVSGCSTSTNESILTGNGPDQHGVDLLRRAAGIPHHHHTVPRTRPGNQQSHCPQPRRPWQGGRLRLGPSTRHRSILRRRPPAVLRRAHRRGQRRRGRRSEQLAPVPGGADRSGRHRPGGAAGRLAAAHVAGAAAGECGDYQRHRPFPAAERRRRRPIRRAQLCGANPCPHGEGGAEGRQQPPAEPLDGDAPLRRRLRLDYRGSLDRQGLMWLPHNLSYWDNVPAFKADAIATLALTQNAFGSSLKRKTALPRGPWVARIDFSDCFGHSCSVRERPTAPHNGEATKRVGWGCCGPAAAWSTGSSFGTSSRCSADAPDARGWQRHSGRPSPTCLNSRKRPAYGGWVTPWSRSSSGKHRGWSRRARRREPGFPRSRSTAPNGERTRWRACSPETMFAWDDEASTGVAGKAQGVAQQSLSTVDTTSAHHHSSEEKQVLSVKVLQNDCIIS